MLFWFAYAYVGTLMRIITTTEIRQVYDVDPSRISKEDFEVGTEPILVYIEKLVKDGKELPSWMREDDAEREQEFRIVGVVENMTVTEHRIEVSNSFTSSDYFVSCSCGWKPLEAFASSDAAAAVGQMHAERSNAAAHSDVPIYERPGRELPCPEWFKAKRKCDNCEFDFHAIARWSDGTKLCLNCSRIRKSNLRTAAEAGRRTGDNA